MEMVRARKRKVRSSSPPSVLERIVLYTETHAAWVASGMPANWVRQLAALEKELIALGASEEELEYAEEAAERFARAITRSESISMPRVPRELRVRRAPSIKRRASVLSGVLRPR